MPGWHDATTALRAEGKFQTVGVIQEQHPDRCRLFMQWKQMDWPILVDALDRLEVTVVPITLLIDEHGVIRRQVSPREDPQAVMAEFLAADFDAPEGLSAPAASAPASALRDRAEAALMAPETRIDEAIKLLERAFDADATDGWTAFRLGVAYRMRYDSAGGAASDFADAIRWWTRALELDPNNYIWRRRLQQYGPRLDKPYPFYDWVASAREEIRARGEAPSPLTVEPAGAELTAPLREFLASEEADDGAGAMSPDPEGKVLRDPGRFVGTQIVTVPREVRPGESARVHLEFRPNGQQDAHWNNEARGLVVWLSPPEAWQVDARHLTVDNPPDRATSDEVRRVEFELVVPSTAKGDALVPAYALYYVCEGINGQCLYRRQDLEVAISVAGD